MRDFIDNGVIQVILAVLVVVVILGVFGWLKFRRDEKIVMDVLKNTGVENLEDAVKTTEISKKVKGEK